MKAFWLAFASLASIGSVQAGEIASPATGAKIGETAISRMYRVAWLANFGRRQVALQRAPAVDHPQTRKISEVQSAALVGTAAAKAAVAARMQAIAAQVDEEMRGLAAGQPLQYRLHVDCSSRFVSATRPPQGAAPAILAAFGSDVESVKVSVESCAVKVYWRFLDREERTPHMRAYSVSLPLGSTDN